MGSNMGDRLGYLRQAVSSISDFRRPEGGRISVTAVSDVFESDPVGGPPDQGPYLNVAVELETDLSPESLLAICGELEANAARQRAIRWGPRTLDVDILLFGDEVIDLDELVIPHPRMWERAFVLVPLADIAPEVVAYGNISPGILDQPIRNIGSL